LFERLKKKNIIDQDSSGDRSWARVMEVSIDLRREFPGSFLHGVGVWWSCEETVVMEGNVSSYPLQRLTSFENHAQ